MAAALNVEPVGLGSEETEKVAVIDDGTPETFVELKAKFLKEAVDSYLDKIIAAASVKLFQKYLSKIHSKNGKILQHIRNEFCAQLRNIVVHDIDNLYTDENVFPSLRKLDKLINECKSDSVAWRPSGIPAQDVADHLKESKRNHNEKVAKLLKQLESENEAIVAAVQEQKDEINELSKKLENEAEYYSQSMRKCEKVMKEDLRNFMECE